MEIKPTESELEILQVIWKKGQCTVRDVHEELAKNKDAGYTTTLKLMQIMHDKGLVERDTTAKTHLYKALITREQAQQTALDKIISTVFKGSTSDLVIQALGHHRASKDEIDAIKDYLKQFERERRDWRSEISWRTKIKYRLKRQVINHKKIKDRSRGTITNL